MTPDTMTHFELALGTPTVWWILSTAVATMPEPQAMSSPWYLWAYNFLQRLAANHSLVKK